MGWNFGLAFALFSVSAVLAADWYAKDNLQPGHDPTILRTENGYILMSTNNNLSMWTSEDMYAWEAKGQVFQKEPAWLESAIGAKPDGIWAPDLFKIGNQYGIFYCGSVMGSRTSAIGVTTNSNLNFSLPVSGWTDQGEIVRTTTSSSFNAIDADIVITPEGEYWMTFGSWNKGGIRLIKIDSTTGKQASDDKTNYKIATRDGHGIEGPSLIEHGGQYFLFTAWDVCCNQGADIEKTTYKTKVGRADKVTGPYKDRDGVDLNEGGGTLLMERYGRYVGPGGGEAFQDLNRIRFVHHYYDLNGDKFNHIHIRDVVFTDDNWIEMGQPFLGRYLSAEVEHGVLTRAVSGDLAITRSETASNGEYLAYVNTAGSKIHLPMNIMQAGEFLLRYRYANGGDAAATHKVTINGKSQTVTLPPTGSWGTFPEKSVVMVPATLKRGSNFIDIEPSPNGNFAELDRIDFLRVIRDTIPANGFDNGTHVRLTKDDVLAMKDGGYAIFENVVTDSIKSQEVSVEVKSLTGGKLSIRDGKKDGTVLSECELAAANAKSAANGWTEVLCSNLKKLSGVKDFYLTASGVSGEVLVGNIVFASASAKNVCNNEPCEESSSSGDLVSSSSTTAIIPREIHGMQEPVRKGYRDLKGRSFDKQIPYRVMF